MDGRTELVGLMEEIQRLTEDTELYKLHWTAATVTTTWSFSNERT